MLSDGTCDCSASETTTCQLKYDKPKEPKFMREGIQIYFRNKWDNRNIYEIGDIVSLNGVFYIATKKNIGMTPSSRSVFWEVFLSDKVHHCGDWSKNQSYEINDIVRYDGACFIATECSMIGTDPKTNKKSWASISKDDELCHNKSSLVEAYNQSTENVDINEIMYPKKEDSDMIDLYHNENQLLYVSKQTNSKFMLNLGKTKWKNQIKFDNVLESTGKAINMQSNNIVFNNAGFYKITVKIIFSGVNQFKLAAYLLNPSDSIQSDTFNANKKINASVYSQTCAASVKNCVHYTFPVNVKNALSTLIIITGQTYVKLTSFVHTENELVIYGKGKTWMLIEKIK